MKPAFYLWLLATLSVRAQFDNPAFLGALARSTGGGAPSGRSWDSATLNWATNVAAGGFGYSGTTLTNLDVLVVSLKGSNLWSKVYLACPVAGSSVGAAGYYLKYPGANTAAVQNGAAASYTETGSGGGVTGNGSSTYWNTGFNPATEIASLSSCGLWTYVKTAGAGGTSSYSLGANDVGFVNELSLGWLTSGSSESGAVGAASAGQRVTGFASAQTGFLGVQTSGSRSTQYYRNAVAAGTPASGSGSFANRNLFFMAANNGGTASTFSARRYASWWVTEGLDASETANFYTCILNYETAMGRN